MTSERPLELGGARLLISWPNKMDPHYHPFLVIALIAVLAPLSNELPVRFRIPSVVLEIGCGILVGPQVLDWVRAGDVMDILWKVGMSFLFLLAGIEIDFSRIRGRPLKLAAWGWLLSLALGIGAAWLLHELGLGLPVVLVALALTT